MNTQSLFERFNRRLHCPNSRLMAILLVALAWSGLAFCGEIQDAAKNGDLAKVRVLLKENPDLVFSKDNYGGTPLLWAAMEGHKDVVELLLANKADINVKANDGTTPLITAVVFGHKDVVELLLAQKPDVNAKTNIGATALHAAADKGYKAVAEMLLANKADINAKDNVGLTPLHYAAGYGHKDVAELLLDNKADVNIRNNDGLTPMQLAAYKGQKALVALLRHHQHTARDPLAGRLSASIVTKSKTEASTMVRNYLAAAATLDSAATKPFLMDGCHHDYITEFQAKAKSGWTYVNQYTKITGKKINESKGKATIIADFVFSGGGTHWGRHHIKFFLVLKNGTWKISGFDPAPTSARPMFRPL
jgi:ankyrin repeat protein